jgi:hypothetical protein
VAHLQGGDLHDDRRTTSRTTRFDMADQYQFVKAALVFISTALLGACTVEVKPEASPVPTSFAAYGDMPYRVKLPDGRTDEQVLIQDIAPEIRRRGDIPFVIHVGDVGRPEFACNDAWLEQTRLFWKNDLVKPVFYTPGDNEWTDCDREGLAARTSELGRLDAIRRIFFGQARNLAPEWRYEEQSGQPENGTWWHRRVRFVTQHLVSKDNGRRQVLLDDPRLAIRLADERDSHNRIWLDHAFEMARESDTAAVVVAMQLDPFGAPDGKVDALSRCLDKPAYREFCSHLQNLAAKLGKPVLLIHGDTNAYCLDQPFSVAEAPRLWRLNAPGDYSVIDVAVISFDPANSGTPFKVTGLLSGKNAPQVCDYSRQ